MVRAFLLVLALFAGNAAAVTDIFTASGTWTAPAGVTSVDVEVWGGGGAGGGNATNSDGGGGGGGGAYSKTVAIPVVPGNTYTVTVGAGGVGGTGTGGAGGDSWFSSAATILAKGGAGGAAPVGGAGGVAGAGGAAASGVGSIKFSGGNGGTGRNSNTGRGGPGGSSAGTAADGTSGAAVWATATAAAPPAGGGIGGDGGNANGADGLPPASGNGGGGGGGAERNTLGGDGAPGMVTITYTPASGGAGSVTSNPTLCVNDTGIGTQPWTGLTNVTAQDNVYATATATNSQITNYLKCTGYGFSIPAGATITGITVGPWVNATRTFTVNAMQLVKGDVIQATNLAAGTTIPNGGGSMLPAPTQLLFGGAANLWGNTWTVDDINSPTFGAAFAAQRGTFNTVQTVGVDAMPITIDYTLPPTPVAEYRMDESGWAGVANEVADSSVNALHGTAQLNATTAAAKMCNGANLSANYVEVADSPLLDISDSLTVAAWIKPSRWGGAPGMDALMTFLSKDTNYEAHIDSTGHVFWWWGTGSMTSTATVPIGSWTHVALVYASGSQTIYINGVASGTATFAGVLPVNVLPLQIGDDQAFGGGTRRFDGMIDEVKIFNAALSAGEISAGYANENAGANWDGSTRTCPSYGPHHIEIQHDGGGLTCSAETVTIRACADAAVPCNTLYTAGGLSVTLAPGGQVFTIGGTGINNAASVQQTTTGSATLSAVSVPAATDATPTTCWNTATSTASCAMTFSDSGFVVTAPDHVSCNNASVTIEAVQTAPGTGRCVPAYQNVSRAVNLYTAYASPVTGTMAASASADGGTNWFAVNTASPGTAQNLAFDATGKATILLNYQDAGQLTLNATGTAPTGKAMTGSDAFVVAPASFAFSGIPAAPLTAGQAFNATVTAVNACATPATTPNFTGQTVTITSSNPLPGLGNATAIDTPLTATSGTGSANLTWDEVGTIDLNANLSAYLGSTLSISGAQAGVGSFRPAYFDTAVVVGPMPCPLGLVCPASNGAQDGFIYSGQPFSVQVTARNLGGGTTANYAGAFARATALAAWDALGSTTTQNPGPGALASNAIAAADFAAGVATVDVPTYTFGAAATAPTDIFLRAADTDGVTSLRAVPATSVEGGVTVASGRIRLTNGHGSELLPLPLTATVQYFNQNAAWVASTTDVVTTLAASDFALAFPAGTATKPNNLAACETAVAITGASPVFAINLSAPGSGNDGWTNLTLNLDGSEAGNGCAVVGGAAVAVTSANRPWLQFPVGTNPAARATFGVYRGDNSFIYLRENY